jgi:hypothetical protein
MTKAVYPAAEALALALERPLVGVEELGERRLRVSVPIGKIDHQLELRWVGRGWPADVERALFEVPDPWPRQLVLAGERFSPKARDVLRLRDANWVDKTGAARIETTSGLFVLRHGRRAPTDKLRWSSSSIEIAEFLLARPPGEMFNAIWLAEQTGWSHPQTTGVLRRFSDLGWVEKVGGSRGVGSGWRLAEPGRLLDAWSDHVATHQPQALLAHRALQDPMQFLRSELASELSSQQFPWAVSGWAGLELAAPFVTAVPLLQVYIDESAFKDGRLRTLLASVGLREVEEGARVEFRRLSRLPLSLSESHNGIPVVDPARLYADLRALGGRGEDAADHVREELLRV